MGVATAPEPQAYAGRPVSQGPVRPSPPRTLGHPRGRISIQPCGKVHATETHKSRRSGTIRAPGRPGMRDRGCGLRGTPLPLTPVNRPNGAVPYLLLTTLNVLRPVGGRDLDGVPVVREPLGGSQEAVAFWVYPHVPRKESADRRLGAHAPAFLAIVGLSVLPTTLRSRVGLPDVVHQIAHMGGVHAADVLLLLPHVAQ